MTVRLVSVGFSVLALAVFKPFGLGAWQRQAYFHMLAIGVLGMGICMLTECILKYVVRMPRSTSLGVGYIIRRNLWFQLINTPLVSLMICLYRHFLLSDRLVGNRLSWGNYFETLVIIAFCSFAIGLYWRFKFRSRYLSAELDEARLLNEQLQKMQTVVGSEQPSSKVKLTGTTSETVALPISDLLYIESVGNYVKIYWLCDDKVRADMIRATSRQMEDELSDYPMIVRCHRAFLVNLTQVEQVVSKSGSMQLLIKHSHDTLPVSRSNMSHVKDVLVMLP
jgi:hypothetical protein